MVQKRKKKKMCQFEATNGKKLNVKLSYCIWKMFLGMSIKEIASELKMSQRSVEEYIVKIKKELNCYSRSAIIKIILANEYNKNMIMQLIQEGF